MKPKMSIIEATEYKEKLLINENFNDNSNGWEEIEDKNEFAAIKGGQYLMENPNKSQWNYYAIHTFLKPKNDFLLESEIELVNHKSQGHFGIIWGFDKKFDYANRFTVSADGKRILIMFFERNHRQTLYRFQLQHEPAQSCLFKFSIQKAGPYYRFYLNEELVNIVHEYHLPYMGDKAGFYIEPGIRIQANQFALKLLSKKK
jgi:hypothetical protein